MAVRVGDNGVTIDYFTRTATAPGVTAISFCGWVRPHAAEAWKPFVSLDDETNWCNVQWGGSGAVLQVINYKDTYVALTAPNDEAWAFFAGTRNADGNLTGYIGGEGVSSLTAGSQTNASDASEFTPTRLSVGRWMNGAAFDMDVAHVRIWEAVLSQGEFEAEMLSATAVKTASLWAEYRFGDGALTTDSSGNSRTLTTSTTPAYVADPTIGGATGQFARPSSDVADGNWLNASSNNTDLYASIDEETASDADYIVSGATPTNDTCTVGLSTISTPAAGTITMRIRAKYL